jgi:ABC-type thiamine transport system substrate-binding protein
MIRKRLITLIATTCLCVAASSLNAATIPAGTTLAVSTLSSISSQDPVGRTFAAQIDHDVAVKGMVLLKAGTKAFGKIKSSRANPRKSGPLTLDLTSISVNGRNVAVKTNTFQPGSSPRTGRQAQYGHTAGTLLVSPGTKMQFQLVQPATL